MFLLSVFYLNMILRESVKAPSVFSVRRDWFKQIDNAIK